MYKVTVLYGHPQDPDEFERYYFENHLPLAAKLKGVKGFTAGKVVSLNPNQSSPYYRMGSLYFDSPEAFESIFASPEGRAVVADLQNFATGGVSLVGNEEQVFVPLTLSQVSP